MKNLLWAKAIKTCADPQRARHFLDLLSATEAGPALEKLAEEQASSTITGLTHQNLGEQIGTYRETTTQTLNLFKSAGLIDIGRKRITILDGDGLRRIADQT